MRRLSEQTAGVSGPIPTFLCNFKFLQELNLFENQISGKIPDCLFDLRLYQLNTSSNQLAGIVPASFGNAGQLQVISLSLNKLTGELPMSMKRLSLLRLL